MKNSSFFTSVFISFFLATTCATAASVQMRSIRIDADDRQFTISVTMDRQVPVRVIKTRRGAVVYHFKNLRVGREGWKERPESLLVYSITVRPTRGGLRLVANLKQFLPDSAVTVSTGYVAAKKPTYKIVYKNSLASMVPPAPDLTTVVIDPGHGGIDPGNLGVTVHEKVVTMSLSKTLKRVIDETPGYRAFLTHEKDVYMPLEDRPKVAALYGADLMVSIHANAFTGKAKVRGFEVFRLSKKGFKSINKYLNAAERKAFAAVDMNNFRLAQSIREKLADETGLRDRGVKRDELVVTRVNAFPTVLIETGFLSDKSEEAKLKDPKFQKKMAKAIRDGIVLYSKRKAEKWKGPVRKKPRRRKRRRRNKALPPPQNGHVVKRGESLSLIAASYKVDLDALIAKNSIKNPDKIKIGQVILIPPRRVSMEREQTE